ncbi:MAG: MBL fold metallo-hydrolase [Clostridiaceae bacterium]|nr:MBL fold metallo-hydrolase [Clostridiaceae bacterium]
MKLTILGNNGPYQAAGGACSGYLVETGNAKVLMDCGNGVLANLQKICTFEELDAILLSHLHSDHVSDMAVLKYALVIKNTRGLSNKIIPVYAPRTPEDEYNRLNVENAFSLHPIGEDLKIEIKDLTFTFKPMKHPVESYAICIETEGKRFVYSGDTAWTENLIDFSKGADLLLVDAGLQHKDKVDENVPHLTSLEIGILAKQAGVKRVMLTHFWPGHDLEVSLQEAKQNFDNTELSVLMKTYEL